MKYKVVTDTRKVFEGVEVELDVEKLGVGQVFEFLGDVYEITQVGDIVQFVQKGENGRVIVLWSGDFGRIKEENSD